MFRVEELEKSGTADFSFLKNSCQIPWRFQLLLASSDFSLFYLEICYRFACIPLIKAIISRRLCSECDVWSWKQ